MNNFKKDIKLLTQCINERWTLEEFKSWVPCGLCDEYYDSATHYCGACPIAKDSGAYCEYTPYYNTDKFIKSDNASLEMRQYLITLKEKLEHKLRAEEMD